MASTMTYDDVKRGAFEDMTERIDYDPEGFDPSDDIHEIADGGVPVYTHDRFAVLASSVDIATRELELAGDVQDLTSLAGIAIYEQLVEDLWEQWRSVYESEVSA